MTMTIFLLLNGLGVGFLLYALANFWKEGRRSKKLDRKYAPEVKYRDWADVLVVTHPISHSAQGGVSVIPFQARGRETGNKPVQRPSAREAIEMPLRRISTR
jgi:hypothetical protein